MNYEKAVSKDVVIVRVREERLTSHEAPEMKVKLLELLIGEGEVILINLKDVKYMDSTGIGAFLFGVRQAEQHNKEICFCDMQPKVQFLIHIAHLEQVMDIYETEEKALKELQ
jgi:anti-sigma B factor antagonist